MPARIGGRRRASATRGKAKSKGSVKSRRAKRRESLSTTLSKGRSELLRGLRHRTFATVKPGVLTVAVYANFYPIAYKQRGRFQGLDVLLMRRFAKAAGLRLELVEANHFDGIWLQVANGAADVSIGGIGMTPGRMHPNLAWSIPYFRVQRTVVYNRHDPLRHFPQDVRRTVLGTVGSTGWIDAQTRASRVGKDKFMKPGTTDPEDVRHLMHGDVQGLMRGSFVGRAIVDRSKGKLAMAHPWEILPELVTSDGEVFAFPTHKDSGLAAGISAWLTFLRDSGQLTPLLTKYHLLSHHR